MMGTGTKGPATATMTSPASPLPPMPSTTTFSTYSRSGSPSRPWAAPTAVGHLLGQAGGHLEHAERVEHAVGYRDVGHLSVAAVQRAGDAAAPSPWP